MDPGPFSTAKNGPGVHLTQGVHFQRRKVDRGVNFQRLKMDRGVGGGGGGTFLGGSIFNLTPAVQTEVQIKSNQFLFYKLCFALQNKFAQCMCPIDMTAHSSVVLGDVSQCVNIS